MAKILWASETGNSEEISRMINDDSFYKQIPTERFCLGEIGTSFNLTSREVLVVVVSSTGDGEMPDNGLKFYRWLREFKGDFSEVRFTILGLGDSNYTLYQGNPRFVERRLTELGGTPFYPRGEVDEQCGLEEAVEEWIDGLWEPLAREVQLLKQKPEQVEIVTSEVKEDELVPGLILGKRIITQENATKKIVEIKISTNGKKYVPGTSIAVHPHNSEENVRTVLEGFKLEPNFVVQEIPGHFLRCKGPESIFELFLKHIDLTFPVKTRCATVLAGFLNPEEEADLRSGIDSSKISMSEGYSLLELSSKYHSWNIEIPLLVESLPLLVPRYFSISTSPINSPDSLNIAFTVTGVCTSYLDSLVEGDTVEYSIKEEEGVFWPGISSSEKILFISTGTGISPFRGIMEHLALSEPKTCSLIHGCRNSNVESSERSYDFLYEEDVKSFVQSLGGSVRVANSRSEPQKYIQDLINETEDFSDFDIALLCGNFSSNEISDMLKLKNLAITITEEWEGELNDRWLI